MSVDRHTENRRDKLRRIGIPQFVDRLKRLLGDNLCAVVVTGSVARGDENDNSDLDVWVVVRDLALEVLDRVRDEVEISSVSLRMEVGCVAWAEMQEDGFKRGFSPVQCYLDGVVMYGSLPPRERCCSAADIQNEGAQILTFLLMSIRILISSSSESGFGDLQSNPYLTKPFLWAARYEILLRTGRYPRSNEQLLSMMDDPVEQLIVRFVQSGYDANLLRELGDEHQAIGEVHQCYMRALRRITQVAT